MTFVIYLFGLSIFHWPLVNASDDDRAENFGREVLSTAPPDAIVFATGDYAIFSLWYFHFALDERPDIAVIASIMLHHDWYQETLHYTYPSLVVPGPFPWIQTITAANPMRPVCFIQYGQEAEISCSGVVEQ